MTIRAKFSSVCPKCGERIAVGSEVEWSRGEKARHTSCPSKSAASSRIAAPRAPRAPRNTEPALKPGEQYIQRGGHDPAPYTVGETLRMGRVAGGGGPDGHYFTITWAQTSSRRGCEDNQEFDRRYIAAHARPATDEEAAPVAARIAAAEATKTAAENGVRALEASKIQGEVSPLSQSLPAGCTPIWQDARLAGSEAWYVDPEGTVWFCRSDYDMGPSVWRTTATVAQVEAVRASGLYRPSLLPVSRS